MSGGLFQLLGRHQVASLSATAVDFGTMVLLVEAFGFSPVWATAIGATCGAVTNFLLGRHWVFRAKSGRASRQAIRYGLVSAASAAWNTLGEHLLVRVLGVQYLMARVVVAMLVSFGWNFPLQRAYVFRVEEKTA